MILYDFVLYGRINKSPVLSNFERFIRRETMGDQAKWADWYRGDRGRCGRLENGGRHLITTKDIASIDPFSCGEEHTSTLKCRNYDGNHNRQRKSYSKIVSISLRLVKVQPLHHSGSLLV